MKMFKILGKHSNTAFAKHTEGPYTPKLYPIQLDIFFSNFIYHVLN